jgi:hypothetical protein
MSYRASSSFIEEECDILSAPIILLNLLIIH